MKWKSKEENVKFIAIAMLVKLINIRKFLSKRLWQNTIKGPDWYADERFAT